MYCEIMGNPTSVTPSAYYYGYYFGTVKTQTGKISVKAKCSWIQLFPRCTSLRWSSTSWDRFSVSISTMVFLLPLPSSSRFSHCVPLRSLTSDLDRSLNRSEVDVQQVSEEHGRVAEELKSLSLETQKQQERFNSTQQQVLHIKHSDPVGMRKLSVSLCFYYC